MQRGRASALSEEMRVSAVPQEVRLSAVSYVVLGFVEWASQATPYRLKQLVARSVGNFWTLQHAQLYTEPERLAKAGYLTEERERGGRRRKLYTNTDKGGGGAGGGGRRAPPPP